MRRFLVCISLCLLAVAAVAQSLPPYPAADGDRAEYSSLIDTPRGHLSGLLVLLNDGGTIRGAMVNEFGITQLGFSYQPDRDRVRLETVVAMMDRWYIRRVLRRDLRSLMHALQRGEGSYTDEKHHISYKLMPMEGNGDDGPVHD